MRWRASPRVPGRSWKCAAGQTHSIVKFGIDELLPNDVTLVHGPGCPVCVTPLELIEKAIEIASRPGVIFCSFGDMLRVPGDKKDLLSVKAEGGDVRIVYSPLDAVAIARRHPDRQVVFFAVGFETTAPANAMAVYQADAQGVENFSMLVSHVLVPPAMEAILSSPANRVQGFLAAGHVCTVMGYTEYEPLAAQVPRADCRHRIRAAGSAPGLYSVREAAGRGTRRSREPVCARGAARAATSGAGSGARRCSASSRASGAASARSRRAAWACRSASRAFDAETRFGRRPASPAEEPAECISGLILQGLKKPHECPAFGTAARRNIRWARRWCRRRARARRTTGIAGFRRREAVHGR